MGIFVEDSESAVTHGVNNHANSGDTYNRSPQSQGNGRLSAKARSQCDEQLSTVFPYAKNAPNRRVSEQEAQLMSHNDSSHLHFGKAGEDDSVFNFNSSDRSKTNSAKPIRGGNCENYSDGVLCPQAVPLQSEHPQLGKGPNSDVEKFGSPVMQDPSRSTFGAPEEYLYSRSYATGFNTRNIQQTEFRPIENLPGQNLSS